MSAREDLILAGATPEQVDAYARELANEIRNVDKWMPKHLRPRSVYTYRSLARRFAAVIDPEGR